MMAKRLVVVFCLALSGQLWGEGGSPGGLLQRPSTPRFDVASGRIVLPGLSRAASRTLTQDGESLTLNPTSEEPTLSYQYDSPQRRLSVDFRWPNNLRLEDRGQTETVTFVQEGNEPLRVTVENGGASRRQFAAKSLWHLLVFSPEAASHLLPRLSLLPTNCKLQEQADEIRQLLVSGDSNWQENRRVWNAAIADLAGDDFQSRRMADRRLCAGGVAAAAYLQTLDRSCLQTEQSRRIVQIVERSKQTVDDAESVAAGWMYDADVWCNLLGDESAKVRGLAADHLAALLGRPVRFDATAEPTLRAAQVKVIVETLLR